MPPESTDREILVEVRTTVKAMHDELLGSADREGRIPKLEDKQEAIQDQVNFWRGAIAFVAFTVLVFGGWFIEHLLSGKP